MSSSDLESSKSTLSINDVYTMSSTSTENDHDHTAVFSADEGPFPANVPLLRSCENCRRKKRKCSSHKPVCTRCKAQGESCFYRPTARYFKPLRNSLEKATASSPAAAAATHGRKRASLASTALKSRPKDISSSGGRPRAMSAVSSAIKTMHAPEAITSLSPAKLMLNTASVFSSQPISPMSPSRHHPLTTNTGFTNQQQQQLQQNQKHEQNMSRGDLICGMSSVSSASVSASASASGLSYMGGLGISSGAGCIEESSNGILTPQTSLPQQLSISSASTPQMMLNGQEFAFGSVSPTMVISSPSASSPLASSSPSSIAVSAAAAAAVAAAQQQQQQHQQYLYPQSIAASAAMAAMAAMSAQSPVIYPDSEYNQMVLASALSRQQQQQQQQQQNQVAAALMATPHLNSPPLSTSSFSTAGMTSGSPPLGECISSSYPMCSISMATPQQQMLPFSAWPASVSTIAAATEPMDAALVSGQMASMLAAPPLMAGIPGSPNGHGNIGLDFILPSQTKSSFAEWLV